MSSAVEKPASKPGMIYVATCIRFGVREFCGVFRTRAEAEARAKKSDPHQPALLINAEPFPIGEGKKTVYVAECYFEREDLFGYAGVYEDFDTAHRKSGPHGHALQYEL